MKIKIIAIIIFIFTLCSVAQKAHTIGPSGRASLFEGVTIFNGPVKFKPVNTNTWNPIYDTTHRQYIICIDSTTLIPMYFIPGLGFTALQTNSDWNAAPGNFRHILNKPTLGTGSIFDKTGLLSTGSKRFTDTFSVSSATPTISLSSYLTTMSCSNFKIVSAVAYRPGATTSNSPNVTVTAITSNSVSLILNQVNTATITILGINVL